MSKFKAGDILIRDEEFAEETGNAKIVISKVGEMNYLYQFKDGSNTYYKNDIDYINREYKKIGESNENQ